MNHDNFSAGKQKLEAGKTSLAGVSLPLHEETGTTTHRLRRTTRRVEMTSLRAEETVVELECTEAHSVND